MSKSKRKSFKLKCDFFEYNERERENLQNENLRKQQFFLLKLHKKLIINVLYSDKC